VGLSVIDWALLGLDKQASHIEIPAMGSFNNVNKTHTYPFPKNGDPVKFTIAAHSGMILLIRGGAE
jgi:hypothetical protein